MQPMSNSPISDDRGPAQIAWARYRRLMIGMSCVSALAVISALGWLSWDMGDDLSIHMIIATSAGVGLSVLLAGALMGLVFLSSSSGHDEDVIEPLPDDNPPDIKIKEKTND